MIIVAAGSSSRFGSDKMAADVDGRSLLEVTVGRVLEHVTQLVVVCRPRSIGSIEMAGVDVVPGGPTRTASEIAGVDAVRPEADLIGVHDGARPLVSYELIDRLFTLADEVGGAVPVLPSPLIGKEDLVPLREAVVVQTPQVFRADALRHAYRLAARDHFHGHDTADVVARYTGVTVAAEPGDESNIKVTYPADLEAVRIGLRG